MATRPRELASPMAELPMGASHYDLLGVAPTATMDEIRSAHQALFEGSSDADPAALNLARAVLTDPLRRRVYDAFLVSQRTVNTRSGRWWRQPNFWHRATGGLVAAAALGAASWVVAMVWQLFRP